MWHTVHPMNYTNYLLFLQRFVRYSPFTDIFHWRWSSYDGPSASEVTQVHDVNPLRTKSLIDTITSMINTKQTYSRIYFGIYYTCSPSFPWSIVFWVNYWLDAIGSNDLRPSYSISHQICPEFYCALFHVGYIMVDGGLTRSSCDVTIKIFVFIYWGYPATRALFAMRKRGG